MTARVRSGIVYNVQALRAFAAVSVAFAHATDEAGLHMSVSGGGFGVDVFFVVSGFIISYVSWQDPSQFLFKRIIRIVPFYWAATIVFFTIAQLFPHAIRSEVPDFSRLVSSLFFIPIDAHNNARPVLILGWTLNYEMYFYLIFAASLRLSHKYATLVCAMSILTIMALIDATGLSSTDLKFYGDPIVIEFIFGMMVFHVYRMVAQSSPDERSAQFWFVAILTIAACLFLPISEKSSSLGVRTISLGIPAGVFVLLAVVLEKRYDLSIRHKVVLLIGEASYIVYLVHPYVIFGTTRAILRRSGSWPELLRWPLVALMIAAVCAASIGVHVWFERPIIRALRRRLLHAASMVIFAAAPTTGDETDDGRHSERVSPSSAAVAFRENG